MMFYSPSTKGFYTPGQRGTPEDAIRLTKSKYHSLLSQQEKGREIVFRGGKVVTVDPVMTWEQIRARRDKLLRDTDWTQVPDVPLPDSLKAEFTTYRAALRNVPSDFASPADVQWPQKPGAD